jgi:transposase
MARRKKGCRFARSVADDGYGQLVQVLTRQADKRGCAVVQADRFYPWSKTCSDCGAVKTKLPLSEREYTGTTCGLSLDRDVDAAPNLAALARTAAKQAAVRYRHLAMMVPLGSRPLGLVKRRDPYPGLGWQESGPGEPVPTDNRGSGELCRLDPHALPY